MGAIDHLSYSSVSTYLLCPRSWQFRYLDRIETPTSPSLTFGSAFHGAIEDYLVRKALGDDASEPAAFWGKHWRAQLERNSVIEWGRDSQEELCNTGLRMLTAEDVVSTVTSIVPLLVHDRPLIEERVELRVPGVPVPVIGYIDLVEQDGVPCDFKTAARSWSASRAQSELQPVFYLAALNQSGYELNPDLRFRHYVFTKAKSPQVQIWDTERTPSDLFWLFDLIAEVWRGIERGVFPPNPSTWKCSRKHCEYWSLCRGKAL